MAQPQEPLYDIPEPAPPSEPKWTGHQRGQGSLKSVSILDRLLLTVPVWLQLSINPATALHILQREPPGTFLVRNSRTSRRNVLCVRLTDDCVPSFVRQFGIREQLSTFCLETSAISFPDLPRLIAFYCVSRDVLPFPLELPEAIAKAMSHKQLESISHMGVEFWSSQLNYRGPREASKVKKGKKSECLDASRQALVAQIGTSSSSPNSVPQHDPADQTDDAADQSSPTLFQEFCQITTRNPKELNCGSSLGALCFVNPLFLQSQNVLHRRRMFKRSFKIRVSTETSSPLSPPLAPPPPPPLVPKAKGKCKAKARRVVEPGGDACPLQPQNPANPCQPSEVNATSQAAKPQTPGPQDACAEVQVQIRGEDQMEGQMQMELGQAGAEATGTGAQDTTQHSPRLTFSLQPSPTLSPRGFLKVSPSPSPSPNNSTGTSPSLSPYQYPCPSPKIPFSLSPFTSPTLEDAYHIPSTPVRLGQKGKMGEVKELAGGGEQEEEEEEEEETETDEEQGKEITQQDVDILLQQMYASTLNDAESCSSLSSVEDEADTPPPSPLLQDSDTLSEL